MTITLMPGSTDLATIERIWRGSDPVALNSEAHPSIQKTADLVATASQGEAAIYGINTGFGKLASVKIPPQDTSTATQSGVVALLRCGRAA